MASPKLSQTKQKTNDQISVATEQWSKSWSILLLLHIQNSNQLSVNASYKVQLLIFPQHCFSCQKSSLSWDPSTLYAFPWKRMVCWSPYGHYNMNEPQIPHSLLASKTSISTMEVWKGFHRAAKKKWKKIKIPSTLVSILERLNELRVLVSDDSDLTFRWIGLIRGHCRILFVL